MKTRIAATIASLLVASFGVTAFAQGVPQAQTTPRAQEAPPQQMPPQQSPPEQQTPPTQQMSAQQQTAPASGAKIKREVKRALTHHGVTATKVTVAVDNGTVTLTGSVLSQKDIAKAKAAAMTVPGVSTVDVSGLHARAR